MPLIVNELQRRGLDYPVLIGGAAINRRFGWRILYTEDGDRYDPGVFYCSDAFEGLEVVSKLVDEVKRPVLFDSVFAKAEKELVRKASPRKSKPVSGHSTVPVAENIPQPKKWGSHVVQEMPLELVFEHLYKKELFRLSWGAKNTSGKEWQELEKEFEARLLRMKKEALKTGWLQPKGIYGYWPAQADGDSLIIYDPATLETKASELTRFEFPRQPKGELLCLSDYFSSVESARMDIVALQVVTVGAEASDRFEELQGADDFTHGLAVQSAEATADYLHKHILRELGLPESQGKRYSWGYPAIPDLDDHEKLFSLLAVEKEIGVSLTSAYQLVPEQSTAAIILHHPNAKYYSVGESRVEQLLKA
jgi:5-methyltetrahydrofolate--homocysteine methyltransferase